MVSTNNSPLTKDTQFLRFLLFILLGSAVLSVLLSWNIYTFESQEDKHYALFIETHGNCIVNEPSQDSSSCYDLTEAQCLKKSKQCVLIKGGQCEQGYCHFPEASQSSAACERLTFCEWKDNRCQQKPIMSCFDYKLRQDCEADKYKLGCKWQILSTGRRCVESADTLSSCIDSQDEQTCMQQTNCIWRKYTTCKEKLPSSEEQEKIRYTCTQQKTKTTCEQDKQCYWDADINAYYGSNR